jgi:hypothetical protein
MSGERTRIVGALELLSPRLPYDAKDISSQV